MARCAAHYCSANAPHRMPWGSYYCASHYTKWINNKRAAAKDRRIADARAKDPIWGELHDLAENAQPMTPDLWAKLKREFECNCELHAEKREPSRARQRRYGKDYLVA